MRVLLFLLCSIIQPAAFGQQKVYSSAEIQRIGDLGRIWGMLHYFHPVMATGNVNTDSLALGPIKNLLADPSAKGFKKSVQQMLDILGDKSTTIGSNTAQGDARLFLSNPRVPVVHRLPGNKRYIAFPPDAMPGNDSLPMIPGLMPDQWDSAAAIILDIRNVNNANPYDFYDFLTQGLPLVITKLTGGKQLPQLFERVVYHSGFVPQSDGRFNIYSSGWRTGTKGDEMVANQTKPLNKPFGFVIDGNTNSELLKPLIALQEAGFCKLIFESRGSSFAAATFLPITFADSLTLNLRVSDLMVSGKSTAPAPDLVIDRITDGDINAPFVGEAFDILSGNASPKQTVLLDPRFVLPRPGRFSESFLPDTEKRIYGLFNWWNAIHYFNPYKSIIPGNWDSVLYKHVPLLIAANDSLSYNLALRHLVTEIHDSHGFFSSVRRGTPTRAKFGYSPNLRMYFIRDKLYVVYIGKDSLQDMSKIKMWDEVISIDGKTVKEKADEMRTIFATSNESTFKRDVSGYMPAGTSNSVLELGLKRNGKPVTATLRRTGLYTPGIDSVSFNDNYKTLQLLPGNIGYVNMGKLGTNEIDSMFTTFSKTKAIIFDIRNYPRGTAWAITPRLTAAPKKAVMFDKPYVDFNYLTGGEDKSTLKSFFVVQPRSAQPSYAGKIVILCNEQTQSQAEYTIMMFQGATKVTVIGSQTAGADGNVTEVVLPGGYGASFSGLGIYYPDGTPTQRVGIKIDITAKPTLEGIRNNRDELLQRALQYIANGK